MGERENEAQRPEDIPEDVWETAERASEWWKPHAAEDYHALRIDFARAILAERAAAEQRGREEEREKLARRYDDEAERHEKRSMETLRVADKMRHDGWAEQCRDTAAAIRRATP